LPFCRVIWKGQKPRPGYPESPQTLGERLTKRRMDLGLSQARLATALGVDVDTLRNWERGRTHPAARCRSRIARFLE